MKRYKTVDEFIQGQAAYQQELIRLREILLTTGLEETVKWGAPCYTYDGKNVVGIGSFKSYFGIWFFQGALLEDPHQKLINAQEGVTKALRQWRFESGEEIDEKLIHSYVKEAVSNVKAGKEIKVKRKQTTVKSPELEKLLHAHPDVKNAFEALTPFKQREYSDYISEAKRSETKLKRIEKIKPMILQGKGLNDRYR